MLGNPELFSISKNCYTAFRDWFFGDLLKMIHFHNSVEVLDLRNENSPGIEKELKNIILEGKKNENTIMFPMLGMLNSFNANMSVS